MVNSKWLYLMNIHKDMDFYHTSHDQQVSKMEAEWLNYAKRLDIDANLKDLIFSGTIADINVHIRQYQNKPEAVAALEYILFTRQSANLVQTTREEWDWQSPVLEESHVDAFLLQIRSAVVQCKDPFLRQRYGYQLVRMETIGGNWQEAEKAYKSYVAGGESEIIRQMGRQWLARALYLSGNRQKAITIYSEIYDQQTDLAFSCRQSLDLMGVTPEEWQTALNSTTNTHKKATLVFLQASLQKREYSADTLRKLVEWEPRSDRTEALLVRMIHAIEHYNMEEDHKRFFQEKSPDSRYEALINLCQQAGDMGKDIRRPALWYAAGSYLALLDGQRDRGNRLLDSARKAGVKDPYIQGQMEMNAFLKLLGDDLDGLNQAQRDGFAKIIQRFDGATNKNLSNNKIRKSLLAFAMHRFNAQNDGPRLVLSVSASGFREASSHIFDILADDEQLASFEGIFYSGKTLDALDTYLKSFSFMSHKTIIQYRAVNHMRRENYEKALQQWSRLETSTSPSTISFTSENIWEMNKPVYETQTMDIFCRMMLEKHKELAGLEKTDQVAAIKCHQELAQIKMSMFATKGISISNPIPRRRDEKPIPYFFDWPDTWWEMNGPAEFYRNAGFVDYEIRVDNFKKAEKHYLRIIELDRDREASAQACVMIQICRNQFAYHKVTPNRKNHEYFYLLNEKYSDTAYHQKFHEECPPAKLFR